MITSSNSRRNDTVFWITLIDPVAFNYVEQITSNIGIPISVIDCLSTRIEDRCTLSRYLIGVSTKARRFRVIDLKSLTQHA